MRAAVYLRISDDREGRALGADRQRADCLALAARLGVDVVEVYRDDDTGTPARVRRAYRRLLADAETGRFGTVIAHTSGRLARQPGEYEDLIDLARRRGTRFTFVAPAAPAPVPGTPDIVPAGAEPPVRIGGARLSPVVGALDTFRRLASDLGPDLRGLVADAAPAVEPLAEGVAGFVRNAMPGVRALVRHSAPAAAGLSRSLPPLGRTVGTFLGAAAPGVPGASALVADTARLAAGQALVWGDVVRRLSQAYLTAREFAGDLTRSRAGDPAGGDAPASGDVPAWAAEPAGVTVDGLTISLHGRWDPADPAAVERVVAAISAALDRQRWDDA
ncbi:recombinase family protein [Planosporangium sp. 12N6]|uniref:recombinase family protein n=1 Tax=Planosporangium spinosum TaxID=3402278 RepID=UPI003CF1F2D9